MHLRVFVELIQRFCTILLKLPAVSILLARHLCIDVLRHPIPVRGLAGPEITFRDYNENIILKFMGIEESYY